MRGAVHTQITTIGLDIARRSPVLVAGIEMIVANQSHTGGKKSQCTCQPDLNHEYWDAVWDAK